MSQAIYSLINIYLLTCLGCCVLFFLAWTLTQIRDQFNRAKKNKAAMTFDVELQQKTLAEYEKKIADMNVIEFFKLIGLGGNK